VDINPNEEAYNRAQIHILRKQMFQLSFYADILANASATVAEPPSVLRGALQAYRSARDAAEVSTAEELIKDFATIVTLAERAATVQDNTSNTHVLEICKDLKRKWMI